jgi:hypothetical protein
MSISRVPQDSGKSQAHSQLATCIRMSEKVFLRIVSVLFEIENNGDFEPKTFGEFVETETDLDYQSVKRWLEIYLMFGANDDLIREIGWAKVGEIAKVIEEADGENFEHWLQTTREQNLATLTETVNKHLSANLAEGMAKPIVATMAYDVTKRQMATIEAALVLGFETSGGDGSNALEAVCVSYLHNWSRSLPTIERSMPSE